MHSGDEAARWRIRVGATWSNSGGIVHNVIANIVHGGFNYQTMENNLAILRSASTFSFNHNVRNAPIAGVNYVIPENDFVVAAGWGDTYVIILKCFIINFHWLVSSLKFDVFISVWF